MTGIFRDVLEVEGLVLTPELTTASVPERDSVNHINLIVAIEARFGNKFRTAELESISSVGHQVELIEAKLRAAAR